MFRRFNSFLSSYGFILYFDYCSITRVDSVSLQATSLLYVHGFIMMSLLFKAIWEKNLWPYILG